MLKSEVNSETNNSVKQEILKAQPRPAFSATAPSISATIWRKLTPLRLICALALIAVPAARQLEAATIIYVNKNAPANSANNGTSWANAYFELRDALAYRAFQGTAENPVEFWVATGTYTPTSGTN